MYIKGDDWWLYKPPKDSSWYWRKVCEIKDWLLMLILLTFQAKQNTLSRASIRKEDYLVSKFTGPRVFGTDLLFKSSYFGLAMKQRLQTRDRLHRFGVCDTRSCLICGNYDETHSHLFFECYFSSQCWHKIRQWLHIHTSRNTLPDILSWTSRRSKFRKEVLLAANAAVTYHILRERMSYGTRKLGQLSM